MNYEFISAPDKAVACSFIFAIAWICSYASSREQFVKNLYAGVILLGPCFAFLNFFVMNWVRLEPILVTLFYAFASGHVFAQSQNQEEGEEEEGEQEGEQEEEQEEEGEQEEDNDVQEQGEEEEQEEERDEEEEDDIQEEDEEENDVQEQDEQDDEEEKEIDE